MVDNPKFAVGILTLAVIFPDIYISGFGGHIAISGCRLLLESLADSFRALHGRNTGFDVEISM